MELEKRNREDNGGANAKRGKLEEVDNGGVNGESVPADEEVEEFFAILKRIQVAVKYFQGRDSSRCADRELTAAPLSLQFEREDFEGVGNQNDRSEGKYHCMDLDLNSDPVCDMSDHGD